MGPLSKFPEEGLRSPLDWFATDPSTVKRLSASDSSTNALPEFPEERFRSPLDWFPTEPSTVEMSSTSDALTDVVPQFSEEELRSTPAAAAKNRAAGRKLPTYAFAAAIVVAAIAAAWWARLVPQTRQIAIEMSTRAPGVVPVVAPRTNAPSRPPIELTSSILVRPSARSPIARVVANAPPIATDLRRSLGAPLQPDSRHAFDLTARQSRQPRGTSVPRRTSVGKVTVAIPTEVPAAPTAPVPTAPVATSLETSPASVPPPATAPPTVASALVPPRAPALAVGPLPEALPSVAGRTEQSGIERALGQYRTAYQRLDAEAAQAVWPSVDVRALARAFSTLNNQELVFDVCVFEITGEVATAHCRGTATYTPKVGSRKPRLEPRQWTFQLRKLSESWKIHSAQTKG